MISLRPKYKDWQFTTNNIKLNGSKWIIYVNRIVILLND